MSKFNFRIYNLLKKFESFSLDVVSYKIKNNYVVYKFVVKDKLV